MPVSESERQSALLRLLWAPAGSDATSDDLALAGLAPHGVPGLVAYRRHARHSARRALVAAYPTVTAMLGEEAMAALAATLWHTQPPPRGDLGEWGGALAEHLDSHLRTHDDLRPWPWLPDAARLDWARHRCERSPAQPLDVHSLSELGAQDPEQVQLLLQAHVGLLRSNWPLHGLWRAHQLPADQHAAAAQQALQGHDGQPQTVLLWWSDQAEGGMPAGRAGVQQTLLSPGDAAWMTSLMAPDTSLGQALSQAHDAFDFSAWFTRALQKGWLQGAGPAAQAGPTSRPDQ